MKEILLELQLNSNGTLGTLISSFDDVNQAESSFHSVLASGAISALPRHGAVLLTEGGSLVKRDCYYHGNDVVETKYVVLEIQCNSDDTVGTLINSYDTQEAAESAYYTILAGAVISQLPKHSAVIMTDSGEVIMNKCYHH